MTKRAMIAALGAMLLAPLATNARAEVSELRMATQFGIASGTKGFTAVAVVTLIEDGSIGLATTARSVLGPDLPLIGERRYGDTALLLYAAPA